MRANMQAERIHRIEQHVQQVMARVVNPDLRLAHGFKHVDRVRRHALVIARAEGVAGIEVVEAAALLHDIGLAYVEERSQHAEVGAELAAGFLREHALFA
jgi:putative nucleotidyltransferase with HDIG domain